MATALTSSISNKTSIFQSRILPARPRTQNQTGKIALNRLRANAGCGSVAACWLAGEKELQFLAGFSRPELRIGHDRSVQGAMTGAGQFGRNIGDRMLNDFLRQGGVASEVLNHHL